MDNLENAIRSAINQQQIVVDAFSRMSIKMDNVIHKGVYDTWVAKCKLTKSLDRTLPLFPVRETASQSLSNLKSLYEYYSTKSITSEVPFCGEKVPAQVATTLAMDAYLSACWALYDCLANIIGRVVGDESIRNNPQGKSNPKLVETFLAVKQGIDVLGLRDILFKSYGQVIGFSYLLRNCFIHEGGMIGDMSILSGETLEEALDIKQTVADKINGEISARYKIPNAIIATEGNVFEQLRKCNTQIDIMFVSLLRFMTGTLSVEIEAFASQDGFRLKNTEPI